MPKNQLRLGGAIFIGLASMLGAGVFVVFRDAYAISAGLIFVAIAVAGVVAILNSASVYRLAQAVDRPGGVYAYSRVYLNDSASFLSGFAFVFGKIGSIAAIAMVFTEYVLPEQGIWPSALAIIVLAAINISGIQRTAAVATVLAVTTFTFLAVVIVASFTSIETTLGLQVALMAETELPSLLAILQGASVVFFAFAGYARVATLGNEVAEPRRNIPRAIVVSLGLVLVIYVLLALALLTKLGPLIATIQAPIGYVATQSIAGLPFWVPASVAALASLGSMLALLAGVSRTAASMSEDLELPKVFARRNAKGSPWVAEVVIAAGAIALTSAGNLSWVIGFSSFSVLFYYAVGHLAAYRQVKSFGLQRLVAILGFVLCAALSFAVPGPAALVSVVILGFALVARKLFRR